MKFGFDLDGTLTNPKIRDLANSLHDAGHKIHVISACMDYDTDFAYIHKTQKLMKIGAKHHHLHLAACKVGDGKDKGETKTKICQELDLVTYIDDEPETVEHMKEAGCPVLLIT